MLNDARTRLRKMAKGWKVIRKAYKKGNNYNATIQNISADVFRTRVEDKNGVVVSVGEFADLELARKAIRGNFIALGCNIPNAKTSESIAVVAPTVTAVTIESISDTSPVAGSNILITVSVKDEYDLPLPGIQVGMTVDGDAVLSAATITTDRNGLATVELSNDTAQSVDVTAAVGAVDDTEAVEFVAGPIASVAIAATPTSLETGTESAIYVTLLDALNNPVVGATVALTVDGDAVLGAASAVSNGSGIASTTLNNATAEVVTVTAAANAIEDTVEVTFTLP